jgi:type I restriction enzyme S subunit
VSSVADIKYGYTESATDQAVGPRFLRITDIQENTVDWDAVPYCRIDIDSRCKYAIKDGDIVFARTGATTGKSFLVTNPPEAVFASYLIRVRVSVADLMPAFVAYYFNTPQYWAAISSGATGSAQGGFNATKLGQLQIPIPPLPEQRRIVAILDEAFEGVAAAKANAETNLRNATELFEGWREALFQEDGKASSGQHLLGDLVNVQNGFAFKSGDYCDGGHFVVRIGNVQDGELVLENPRFIALTDPKQDKFVLNVGDILVSLTGNIGRAAMVEAYHLPAVLNQRVARITTKTNAVSHEWVYAFLTSQSFRQRLQTAGHGAAQQNVSTKEIESVPVCLPSKNEQERQIAQVLTMRSSVADWKESYTRRSAAFDELKASLLHQAFTGQL